MKNSKNWWKTYFGVFQGFEACELVNHYQKGRFQCQFKLNFGVGGKDQDFYLKLKCSDACKKVCSWITKGSERVW